MDAQSQRKPDDRPTAAQLGLSTPFCGPGSVRTLATLGPMGSATARRFALVAVLVLLGPAWCQPALVAGAADSAGTEVVRLAPTGSAPAPAIRRTSAGWWLYGSRPDLGRALVALTAVVLLSLLRPVPWSTLQAVRAAPSALARRRHVISLRAPPCLTAS